VLFQAGTDVCNVVIRGGGRERLCPVAILARVRYFGNVFEQTAKCSDFLVKQRKHESVEARFISPIKVGADIEECLHNIRNVSALDSSE
jgi:hypothetical protein